MFMDRLFRRNSVNSPIAQIARIYSGILANLGKAGFMWSQGWALETKISI
jgi:hypothetical protein